MRRQPVLCIEPEVGKEQGKKRNKEGLNHGPFEGGKDLFGHKRGKLKEERGREVAGAAVYDIPGQEDAGGNQQNDADADDMEVEVGMLQNVIGERCSGPEKVGDARNKAFQHLEGCSGLIGEKIEVAHGEGKATEKKNEFGISGNERERSAGRAKLKTKVYQREGDEEEKECRKFSEEGSETGPCILHQHVVLQWNVNSTD